MYRFLLDDGEPGCRLSIDRHAGPTDRDRPMMCADIQIVSIPEPDQGIISPAEFAGAFDDRLEYRLDVGRRRRDHLEDIRAAGLEGEGLFEIAGFRLPLLEQPHVADGNDSLVGEGLNQLYLARSKRTGLRLGERKHALDLSVTDERDAQHRPVVADALVFERCEVGVGANG